MKIVFNQKKLFEFIKEYLKIGILTNSKKFLEILFAGDLDYVALGYSIISNIKIY